MDSSECDAATPICVDMACVPCTDAADGDAECAAKDGALPVCREDGQCVQCTSSNADECGDMTPVCDDGTSSCVGCTYHEQCESTACDIASGSCFEDCVVHVDGDGRQDFDNIGDGIAAAIAGGCVLVVHELEGEVAYQEPLVIDGDTVAIFAAPGEAPRWEGTGGNPTLTVTGGANVYIQSMWMVGNSGTSLDVEGGSFVQVRNCFVDGDDDVAAVDVTSATFDASYSTIAGGFGTAAALRCDGPATVEVRDSILVARTDMPELDCTTDVLQTSATEAEVPELQTTWFVNFAVGDFHLSGTGEAIFDGIAEWNTGDPASDIDDQGRAGVDGTPEAAGADLPP